MLEVNTIDLFFIMVKSVIENWQIISIVFVVMLLGGATSQPTPSDTQAPKSKAKRNEVFAPINTEIFEPTNKDIFEPLDYKDLF